MTKEEEVSTNTTPLWVCFGIYLAHCNSKSPRASTYQLPTSIRVLIDRQKTMVTERKEFMFR